MSDSTLLHPFVIADLAGQRSPGSSQGCTLWTTTTCEPSRNTGTGEIPSLSVCRIAKFARYPIVLDAVIMSMSTGFVGTTGSTSECLDFHKLAVRDADNSVSILSCRRMTSWNSGHCAWLNEQVLAPEGWKWE